MNYNLIIQQDLNVTFKL